MVLFPQRARILHGCAALPLHVRRTRRFPQLPHSTSAKQLDHKRIVQARRIQPGVEIRNQGSSGIGQGLRVERAKTEAGWHV